MQSSGAVVACAPPPTTTILLSNFLISAAIKEASANKGVVKVIPTISGLNSFNFSSRSLSGWLEIAKFNI